VLSDFLRKKRFNQILCVAIDEVLDQILSDLENMTIDDRNVSQVRYSDFEHIYTATMLTNSD